MIQGYEIGTEVKWNREDTLTTGHIEQVYHQPTTVELDGETVHVAVTDNSPSYLIRHHTGEHVILPHRDIMMEHTNHHT